MNEQINDRAGRLTPIDRDRDLLPWRPAKDLKRCSLYWIPVKSFPIGEHQRNWIVEFLNRFGAHMAETASLRCEQFLSFKILGDHKDLTHKLHKTILRYSPLLGLSRRPGEDIKSLPDTEELQKDREAYASGKKKLPTISEISPDYCYWFILKYPEEQRENFLGYGGLTNLFMKPDPNTVPPEEAMLPDVFFDEIAPRVDKEQYEAMVAGTFALGDEFLPKSKELFGKGLEEEPQYPGLFFIVPLLRSRDFFQESDEVVEQWFDLFEVYVNESPEDRGVLLAAKEDLDEVMIEILRQMREEGLSYPVS
jgi:hypothetical protein